MNQSPIIHALDALVTQETYFSTQVPDHEKYYAPLAESFGTHTSPKEHESTYGPIKHMAYDFDISRYTHAIEVISDPEKEHQKLAAL